MSLFKNSSFITLFFGRLVTNVADSIYYVAAMWLVFDLTQDPFYTGIAGFLTSLPWAFQFLVGPLVDRWRIKPILMTTQLLQMLLIALIPMMYWLGILTVTVVLIILPIASFIQQFAYPAQSKALPLVVEKDEVTKANTYFAFAYQGIDFILNAVVGLLIAIIGIYSLFVIDAGLFGVATALFFLVKIKKSVIMPTLKQKEPTSYVEELQEGIRYVSKSTLGLFTIGAIAVNLGIGGMMAILPAFSAVQGGAAIYGYYLAAMSIGGLVGAWIAPFLSKYKMGTVTISVFIFAIVCYFFSALVQSILLSLIFFSFVWIPIGISNIFVPSVIQRSVPTEVLGRVLSVSTSASTISMPLGSLLFGALASEIDIRLTFILCGIPLAFEIVLWLFIPHLRKLPAIDHIDAVTLRLPTKEPINHE